MSRVYKIARQQILQGSSKVIIAASERQELLAEIKAFQGEGLALAAVQDNASDALNSPGSEDEVAAGPLLVVFLVFVYGWMMAPGGSDAETSLGWSAFAAWCAWFVSR